MKNSNSFTNLKNRYVAVLKKCSLINVFGTLALATMCAMPFNAFALQENPANTTTSHLEVDTTASAINPFLNNYGTLTGFLFSLSGFLPMNTAMLASYTDPSSTLSFDFTNHQGGVIKIHTSSSELTYGMFLNLSQANNSTLSNFGLIDVSANNAAYAMHAYAGKGSFTLINSGHITAKSEDNSAFGLYAYSNESGSHTLSNSGTISVTGTGTSTPTSASRAYGMYAETGMVSGSHTLTNSGAITSTSTGDHAYGMYANGTGSHALTNNGNITLNAYTNAYGIYANGTGSHALTNNGTITTTADTNVTYAMYVNGNGNHTITNNGIINITSKESNARAIYIIKTNTNNGVHLVNNTGIINVSAPKGESFEVYGEAPYTVGTYATTLRAWNSNDTVFGTNIITNKVTFDNSTLILRPGTKDQGFEYGKIYNVANMIYLAGHEQTNIEGSIVNATTEVPFLTANLDNSDPKNPKVSLTANVNKDTVRPVQFAKLSADNMHNKVTRMAHRKINKMIERRMARNLKQVSEKAYEQGVILAGDMITYAPSYQEKKWAIYLDAYAGYTGNNEYNYGTHTKGMTLGGEKALSDKLNVGFAMDFSDSTTDGQQGLTADATDITLAVNADYFINNNWYVSGNMALSFGENDMDYMMSSAYQANDDFSSQAFYMAVNTGYIYEINANNIIVPEFGLSYLYTQTDDIAIDFAGSDVYDMHINNDSFSALYANLMVTWQGQYDIARGTLRPSAGLGIRQNLTGSDFDSSIQALGTSFDTVVTEDDTTFITNLGLDWQNGNFSMGVSYSGGFGSEQQSHSGNVKFRLEF